MSESRRDEKYLEVPDTNVLIFDPDSVNKLRKTGNEVAIPYVVQFSELKSIQDKKPEVSLDAAEAIDVVSKIFKLGDPTLRICNKPKETFFLGLDYRNPDHQKIATVRMLNDMIKNKEMGFDNFVLARLISMDPNIRMMAQIHGIEAEDYHEARTEEPIYSPPREIGVKIDPKKIQVIENKKRGPSSYFPYDPSEHGEVLENEGVVCIGDKDGPEWQRAFAAIKRGNLFKIIPRDISAMGVGPYSINGNGPNWSHYIALEQLLDPEIDLIFLHGGAGTGKTVLTVAAAFEQIHDFHQIVVARPPVHIDGKDRLGFLPGSLEEKLSYWMLPIDQAIDFLRSANKDEEGSEEAEKNGGCECDSESDLKKRKKRRKSSRPSPQKNNPKKKRLSEIDKAIEQNRIWRVSLDMLRGVTFMHRFVIIDDSQNLTEHHVTSILTRMGINSKLVLTGDFNQIDLSTIVDKRSCGLAHWVRKTKGQPLVASVSFKDPIRSRLQVLLEQFLKK